MEPMTAKDLAHRLNIQTQVVRCHLKGLIELKTVIHIEKTGRSKFFTITETGRKLLEFPPLGLELLDENSQVRDGVRKKIAILQALTRIGDGIVLTELKQQMRIPEETLRNHLFTRWYQGRKSDQLGLMDLGLVARFGKGVKYNPHVYHLTDAGKQFIEELEVLFPNELSN